MPMHGEIAPHKVAALFDEASAAQATAQAARDALGLRQAQVAVVGPDTARPGRALEPEGRGIFQTLLKAHAALGVFGALAGLVLVYILWAMDVGFVVTNPWWAVGLAVTFGAAAGMMFAGLATLRPDHDPYLQAVQSACRAGRSAVVVHAETAAQRSAAEEFLRGRSADIVSTL